MSTWTVAIGCACGVAAVWGVEGALGEAPEGALALRIVGGGGLLALGVIALAGGYGVAGAVATLSGASLALAAGPRALARALRALRLASRRGPAGA